MNFLKRFFGSPKTDEDSAFDDPNVKRLIKELNDPTTRSATVTELGKTNDPAGAHAIVAVLLGKQESTTRYVVFVAKAIEVLGTIRDPFAVPLLLDVLKGRLETIRKCAADALGNIGHHAAVPDLRAALMNDESWAVRAAAASALGKIGDPTAMPALFEATRDDNQIVRYQAKDGLQKLQSATPAPLTQPAVSPAAKTLSAPLKRETLASEPVGSPLPFIDNKDGTVTDSKTGLMWQKDDDGKSRHGSEARQYANSLALARHSDWRLPSEEELLSLWENAGSKTEIRERCFPSMRSSTYYYSDTYVGGKTESRMSFDDGRRYFSGSHFHYVRCVRGGPMKRTSDSGADSVS